MMYEPYYTIQVLATFTGPRQQLIPLILEISFLLVSILEISPQSLSLEKGKVSLTSVSFVASVGQKTPTAQGDSKLDPRSTKCQLLGYASGSGNYRVQDIASCHVFVSQDVIFEEGKP